MPYAPDLSGRALDGRYELHAVIGEGAFGRVYRGLDRRLAREVAVKVIKPWWAEDPDWVGSFEREAQLLARVSDPGIVQIFDVGQAPEGLYYVSELVDGESLASRLRRGPLAPWDACGIAEQLCRALARAHAERIIHRDVKPANILLSARGQVKVGDFGVARLAEGSTDGAVATVVGTPRYMAPEQARGLPTSPATDVYSVGVVLYEMIAGRPPFPGHSAVELALQHLQEPPPPPPAGTPRALRDVIDCALAKEPERRYADGAAMADALALAVRTAGPAGPGRRGARGAPHEQPPAAVGTAAAGAGANGAAANGDRHPVQDPTGATVAVAPAATELLDRPREVDFAIPAPPPGADRVDRVDRTAVAPQRSARKNINPAARRRRGALLGLVVLLIAGMAGAAILLGGHRRIAVPRLTGLTRSAAAARLRRADLQATYGYSYAPHGAAGTVIAQKPRPGREMASGGAVHLVLSKGPKPVEVPLVVGEDSFDAQAALRRYKLRTAIVPVPAPGVRPGTVTRQAPPGGVAAAPNSRVTLSVSETPRWRPLTSFSGTRAARSVAFRIRGARWRLVYSMDYQGSCTFIVFCSGPPQAEVTDVVHHSSVASFDMNSGADQTQTIQSGPGTFQVAVSPGSDSATYTVHVEDYY